MVGTAENQKPTFTIAATKLYVPVVNLSTQDNVRLLKQLELGFKRTVNWNKYHSKETQQTWNRQLGFLIYPSFQGVNRLPFLSLKTSRVRESYKQYFFPTVEIKDYYIVIVERNFFDQSVKNNLRTYHNIRQIDTG